MADFGRHVLWRIDHDEPALLSEPTTLRLAAVAAAVPGRFDEIVRHELSARDVRIAEVQAMFPPRPRQVAAEQNLRTRIAMFADKFRETLG